jgi:hypothetical protein
MNSYGNLFKIFIWFLIKCVILKKRQFNQKTLEDSENCCLHNKETIQHIYFGYHVSIFIRRALQVTFGL